MSDINVVKRNGVAENMNLEKVHKMVELACKGLAGVSESHVEINAELQFFDGIKTSDIQEILIRSANDLITLESPNYQYVAARLLLFGLRKQGGIRSPVRSSRARGSPVVRLAGARVRAHGREVAREADAVEQAEPLGREAVVRRRGVQERAVVPDDEVAGRPGVGLERPLAAREDLRDEELEFQ